MILRRCGNGEMSDTEDRGKVHMGAHCADCIGRTLLFAGLSPNGCFVHYRESGLATNFKIVVFGSEEKLCDAAPLWVASGVQAHDLAELRSAMAEHKFYSLGDAVTKVQIFSSVSGHSPQ
jgi:hypothetical protein